MLYHYIYIIIYIYTHFAGQDPIWSYLMVISITYNIITIILVTRLSACTTPRHRQPHRKRPGHPPSVPGNSSLTLQRRRSACTPNIHLRWLAHLGFADQNRNTMQWFWYWVILGIVIAWYALAEWLKCWKKDQLGKEAKSKCIGDVCRMLA